MLTADAVAFWYGRRRKTLVLEDFDWTVPDSATTLLLGPNGAGKSTLLKLLCGFETPKQGRVAYGGRVGQQHLYRHVGWMPQEVQPARGLTVSEQVEYAGWLGGLTPADSRQRTRRTLVSVDLEGLADKKADSLSGGQQRRLGLAQAIVRPSDVLLLDEPTAGLDPAQTLNFRQVLEALDDGSSVVISTHLVNELADDADQVAVLDHGQMQFRGTPKDMTTRFAEKGGTLAHAFRALVGGGNH